MTPCEKYAMVNAQILCLTAQPWLTSMQLEHAGFLRIASSYSWHTERNMALEGVICSI